MEVARIIEDIASLPPDAQKQVRDFVAFLKSRYQIERASKKTKPTRLRDEPFIGMWRDREDMKDSTEWVRNLRRREWERS